jgi:hypothetical protein
MHCFTGVDLGGIQVPAAGIQHGGRACTVVRVRSSLNASRLLTAHLPADRLNGLRIDTKIRDVVIPSVTGIERRVHGMRTIRVPKTRSSSL